MDALELDLLIYGGAARKRLEREVKKMLGELSKKHDVEAPKFCITALASSSYDTGDKIIEVASMHIGSIATGGRDAKKYLKYELAHEFYHHLQGVSGVLSSDADVDMFEKKFEKSAEAFAHGETGITSGELRSLTARLKTKREEYINSLKKQPARKSRSRST